MGLYSPQLSKEGVESLPNSGIKGDTFLVYHQTGINLNPLWCSYTDTYKIKNGDIYVEFTLLDTKYGFYRDDKGNVVKTEDTPYTVIFPLKKYGDTWTVNHLYHGYW